MCEDDSNYCSEEEAKLLALCYDIQQLKEEGIIEEKDGVLDLTAKGRRLVAQLLDES